MTLSMIINKTITLNNNAMKKSFVITLSVSLFVNVFLLFSFVETDCPMRKVAPTASQSELVNTLEDMAEWLEQDIEDSYSTELEDKFFLYKQNVDFCIRMANRCFMRNVVMQKEYNHIVYDDYAKIVTDTTQDVICVWYKERPYKLDTTVLDNL